MTQQPRKSSQYRLRLYIAAHTTRSTSALQTLHRLAGTDLAGRYTIEIVDLTINPELGNEDLILTLPTLIRHIPVPLREVIGDLYETEKVLVGLEIAPQEAFPMLSGQTDHHHLRLYISGSTPRSLRALSNIRRFCKTYLESCHVLEVIDIYQSPAAARDGQVVAVPMLVRLAPNPMRRIIGDLSDEQHLLVVLDLGHLMPGPQREHTL